MWSATLDQLKDCTVGIKEAHESGTRGCSGKRYGGGFGNEPHPMLLEPKHIGIKVVGAEGNSGYSTVVEVSVWGVLVARHQPLQQVDDDRLTRIAKRQERAPQAAQEHGHHEAAVELSHLDPAVDLADAHQQQAGADEIERIVRVKNRVNRGLEGGQLVANGRAGPRLGHGFGCGVGHDGLR